ncbi:pentapeptide repeat-containing protein [Paracoccus spongiarum]|uniref:Pentapeptide repeat-containing protein n=1 Tax=Paracoccus spongiarum TaxID=3064387 RepID=A0ABT9JEU4_9RHOB|nr:pentapeptide repeat-containing protein [Paracoccus sp. 2205BS29-5]MDP5308254.1 pentapeptide repeat-containing protein [Paracoccus sp. 2205BS29-5]
MQGAVFVASALKGAVLRGARLQGTNFGGAAQLNETLFRRVQLDAETNFVGTPVHRAAFQDVNLKNVQVMQWQVENSFGDASVSLPDVILRPSHWAGWELKEQFQQEWRRWRVDPDNYRPPRRPNQPAPSLPLQRPGQPAT